jgi:hypothetical protein
MKKAKYPSFSNGTEFMWWTGRNCDLCVKASHLRESVAGEEYTAFRCAINKEITLECAGMIENVSQRTYDICQKADCPYKQTERKKYRKKDNSPTLF